MNVADLIEKLSILVPILLAVGASWKYMPKIRNVVNEVVIPILNALVGFFALFAVPTAQASVFGELGHALTPWAQAFLAVVASALTAVIHDKFLKPILPSSPYRS